MVTFLISVAALILGYFIYGSIVEKIFGINEKRPTPAYAKQDGVDYIPIDTPRNSLIQLLNIAGLGPIFGPIMGALWGPTAFVWIVLGSIFGGAVHDFFSGMISMREGGSNLPTLVGKYMGKGMQTFVNYFTVGVLILVGAVFVTGPANLLATLTPDWMGKSFWVIVIMAYYILATLLPVDQIIGKLYPVFGAVLMIMALGIGGAMIFGNHPPIPELTFASLHPKGLPIWPLMFITIACGAISGFHATQSPIVARTMRNEKNGRVIFYGMMLGEALIALIWAAAGMTLFDGTTGLQEALVTYGGTAGIARQISLITMGSVGGTLAILGVIVLPITSGDTAFRGARLIVAEFLSIPQLQFVKRMAVSVPLFVVGFGLSQMNYDFLWRYFAWSNQTLAMIALWMSTMWLVKHGKSHWVTSIPASFMTAVTFTYILMAPEGFGLARTIAYPVGLTIAAGIILFFWSRIKPNYGVLLESGD